MPKIYVIYRPEDSRKHSRQIIEALRKLYGTSDVNSPNFDDDIDRYDHVYHIEQDVQDADILAVVIGRHWANIVDEFNNNVLHDVYDPVHMAIATASNSRIRIVPILVDSASMPRKNSLPLELRGISQYEPISLHSKDNVEKILKKHFKDIVSQVKQPFLFRKPDSTLTRETNDSTFSETFMRHLNPINEHSSRSYLPSVVLIIVAVTIIMGLIPTIFFVESPTYDGDIAPVKVTLISAEPSATAPQIIPKQTSTTEEHEPITTNNAYRLERLSVSPEMIVPDQTVIFADDNQLFIFVSPELQEVQLIDVATNEILRVLDFKPYTPVYISLNEDESILFSLSNRGVAAWGIPTDADFVTD